VTGEPPPASEASGTVAQLSGTLAWKRVLAGSRSEHDAPVLVGDDGRSYRLLLVGENPFEQPTLRELVGRRLRVRGVWRNGVVRVTPEELTVE
jgi:hypothetical protein